MHSLVSSIDLCGKIILNVECQPMQEEILGPVLLCMQVCVYSDSVT